MDKYFTKRYFNDQFKPRLNQLVADSKVEEWKREYPEYNYIKHSLTECIDTGMQVVVIVFSKKV